MDRNENVDAAWDEEDDGLPYALQEVSWRMLNAEKPSKLNVFSHPSFQELMQATSEYRESDYCECYDADDAISEAQEGLISYLIEFHKVVTGETK